ncbi:putative conserved protein YqhQ [Abditibacterium utsteinense]|uniref:Putative conserved protein YqhQ n=1 Tax=Abditibacterium utsteinense TaxID=1960156 RepID=A0A2S8SQI1_9BACT|nr:DUF1385 domain-containing protein [Abditibacterium utsteinense]PQV63009.1 putative conserved protein YqhQ [Abditibacterium utsteinense]
MSQKPPFQLGGQALIEGVMMRGPRFVGAAVRRKDGSIETRVEEFTSILKKRPYLNLPLVRGIFALGEMMQLGTGYLNWSSNLALEDENSQSHKKSIVTLEEPLTGTPILSEVVETKADSTKNEDAPVMAPKKLPLWMFLLTILGSLGLGALLFIATPNLVAHFVFEPILGNQKRTSIMALTFIEGTIKLCIFIAYVYVIGRRKQIRRVFEYHGAEHKVVYAAENHCPLTPDGARPFDTPHPRCGTGFALLTVVVSILIYSLLPWPGNHFLRIGMRLCMLPLVAGISYEVLKATVNPKLKGLAILVVTPGMWLQRLTTEEPNDEQLEVACEAMRVVIAAENGN